LAYNFSKEGQQERWAGINCFVQAFYKRLPDLKEKVDIDSDTSPVHHKWLEVERSEGEVDGWARWESVKPRALCREP